MLFLKPPFSDREDQGTTLALPAVRLWNWRMTVAIQVYVYMPYINQCRSSALCLVHTTQILEGLGCCAVHTTRLFLISLGVLWCEQGIKVTSKN